MLAYMTAGEAAEKWNISHRRVITLCQENRVPDAAMLGKMWLIPKDATKPVDGRTIRYDKKNPTKPFIKWAGGKEKELPIIKKHLPKEFKRYVEPFVGGGAMLFHMLQKFPNIERVVINDINPYLTTAYRVIKDEPEELIERLSVLEREYFALESEEAKKTFYLGAREIFNEEDLDVINRTKY